MNNSKVPTYVMRLKAAPGKRPKMPNMGDAVALGSGQEAVDRANAIIHNLIELGLEDGVRTLYYVKVREEFLDPAVPRKENAFLVMSDGLTVVIEPETNIGGPYVDQPE